MRRTDRLFDLMLLFRHPRLWRGKELAEKLEVSLRTIYRDIETLVASGVPIEGARGVGYILRAPIFLPPLTLTTGELEALHLGMEIVQQMSDPQLGESARHLLDKLNAVLPSDRATANYLQDLQIFPAQPSTKLAPLPIIRQAIATQTILQISYQRLDDKQTSRQIRPLHIEFWGHVWTCTAWCELRQDFRVFRIDRILECHPTGKKFLPETGKTFQDYIEAYSSKDTAP